MPLTAQECYAKALECEERARTTKSYVTKVQCREMARQWRSRAEELEQFAEQTYKQALGRRWF
jgi:hypothetical protein